MLLDYIRGKRLWRRALPIFFVAVFPVFAAAQALPKSRVSVPHILILPPKMIAGVPATLSVLDAAGRLMPGVVVDLAGGQKVTTDATGRGLFKAPSQPGTFTAKISNLAVTASGVVISADSQPRASAETPLPELRIVSYPHVLALHDRFTIEGTGFHVVADSNHVFLDDQLCVVVASSPISLVVLPGPQTPIGAVNLHVRVEGHDSGPNPVSTVLLDVSGPATTPSVGGQAQLTVHIHGATERVAVEVRNASPKIIQFPGGNVKRLTTSGGEQNIASVDTKFLASGDYTVTAQLIPADTDLPNLEAVRKRLIAAFAYATGRWRAQLDRLLEQIDQAPPDPAAIEAQFKSMLDQNPVGQFGYLLNAAWRDFQKND